MSEIQGVIETGVILSYEVKETSARRQGLRGINASAMEAK